MQLIRRFTGVRHQIGCWFSLLCITLLHSVHFVAAQDYIVAGYQNLGTPNQSASPAGIARSGDLDFITYGPTLAIVDSSNPLLPKPIGFYTSQDMNARAVAVSGDLAVVADGNAGLHLLDISDPTAPALVDHFGSWESDTQIYNPEDLWIIGNACVVLTQDKLWVIDITSLANPVITDEVQHDYTIGQGVQDGSYMYFAQGEQGLQILDVSNPASPGFVGGLAVEGQWVTWVAVDGDTAYLKHNSGIEIVDVSNRSGPSSIGSLLLFDSGSLFAISDALYSIGNGQIFFVDASDPTSLTDPSSGFTQVGTYTGFPQDILMTDDRLMFSTTLGIEIYDRTSPSAPVLVSQFNREGRINGLSLNGDSLTAVAGSAGLFVLDDISQDFPFANESITSGAFMADVATSPTHAFVAAGAQGMLVYDVSTPDSPSLAATLPLPGFAWGIDLVGNTAFVASDEAGLVAVDVSSPGSPAELDTLALPGASVEVLVNASVAYVMGHTDGVHVVNISNPSAMTWLDTLEMPGEAYRARRVGNVLYVACGSGGVTLLDISTPDSPMLVQQYRTSRPLFDVAVNNDHQMLAVTGADVFELIDFSSVSQPQRFDVGGFGSGAPQSSMFINDRFYLADTFMNGYKVEPNPRFRASYSLPGFPPTWSAGPMRCTNGYLYMAARQAGLLIFDISDPAKPLFVGNYPADEFAEFRDLEMHDHFAFVSAGQKVEIIDVSNPSLPTKAGEIPAGASPGPVRINNGLVYVSREAYGIDIYDLANPARPVLIGTYTSSDPLSANTYSDIEFYSTYAYLSAGYDGFVVLDISDPTDPQEIIAQDLDEGVWDAEIAGDILYVVTDTAVKVMSYANNPEFPIILAPAEIGFGPVMVDAVGTTAFTADQNRGLVVVDASVPANPQIPSTTQVDGGGTTALQAYAGYVYVAGGRQLHVFDPANLAAPVTTCEIPVVMGHKIIALSATRLAAAGGRPGTGGLVTIYSPDADRWALASQFSVTGSVTAMHMVGETLFLSADKTHIFDLTDPDNPTQLSEFLSDGRGQMNQLRVYGDLLYAAGYPGVFISNIADPANPYLVGTWPSFAPPQDVVLNGDYAYVANYYDGLQVLDVSNPSPPSPVDVVESTLGEFRGLYLDGNRLLALGQYQAAVFDVSNPGQPVQIGNAFSGGSGEIYDGVLEGDTAYLVTYSDFGDSGLGLRVLDLSDLESGFAMQVGGYVSTANGFSRIIRDGDKTFLGGAQLLVLNAVSNEPVMTIQRVGNMVTIKWSPDPGGWQLEFRPAVQQGEWTDIPNAQSGHAESLDQPTRIYRLTR